MNIGFERRFAKMERGPSHKMHKPRLKGFKMKKPTEYNRSFNTKIGQAFLDGFIKAAK